MTQIQDKAWTLWFYSGKERTKRVLTALVEDAELIHRLKLLAEEMQLRVEISDLANPEGALKNSVLETGAPSSEPKLNYPEGWKPQRGEGRSK